MSPPNCTSKATSATKKETSIIGQASLPLPKTLQSHKEEEETLKNTKPLSKTIGLPQLTPNNNEFEGKIEKTTEILKIVPVSNIEIQPVQHIPKVQPSLNTPRPQVINLPKLQMPSKGEALKTKTVNSQAKEQLVTSQKIQNLSSSFSNENPNNLYALAESTLTEFSTTQIFTNFKSEMETMPDMNDMVNTSNNITIKSKQDPKTIKQIKRNVPKKQNRKLSKEMQSNKSRQFVSDEDLIDIQKGILREELDGEKKRTRRSRRKDNDPEDTIRIESTYVADGLKEDCKRLVEKCLQVYKLNFEKFCDIWKQMSFPSIFHERQSNVEIAELSEEAIHVAKVHMVAKNVNFEENVAGLFLVYALLNHQPYKEFAALRLVPSDVPAIKHLEAEAKRQRRHDVLYILGSVLIKGPCQFHVLSREVALEMPIRKYFDGSIQASSNVESVFTETAECVQHFKDLIVIDKKYAAIRQKLRDRHGGVDKVRRLCTQPAASLFELFRNHVPGGMKCERQIENLLEETKSKAPVQKEDRHNLVKSIKERAMANTVDSMRHLTGVKERHEKSFSSELGKSKVETKSPIRRNDKSKTNKRKGKRKGRSSAITLQELFGSIEDDEMPDANDPSMMDQKKMPEIKMTNDPITVTDLEKLASEENAPSKLSLKDNNCGKAKNLEKNSRKTRAKRSKANKPHNKLLPDLGSENNDNSSLSIYLDEKPKIETKKKQPNKSRNQVSKVNKKNNSKNKNIDCPNSKELHLHEGAINIELNSMPVNDIEIEIIDNFKGEKEISKPNEKKKDKDNSVTKNDSNEIETDKTKHQDSIKSRYEAKIFEEDINTDTINARYLRRKRKEIKRIIKQANKSKETNQPVEFGLKKDTISETVQDSAKYEASLPDLDEIEVPLKRRKIQVQHKVCLKSKLNKMGVLDLANLNTSEDKD